jgi:hypothetical protein
MVQFIIITYIFIMDSFVRIAIDNLQHL